MSDTNSEFQSSNNTVSRLNHALGPVAAGVIIDLIDIMTLGPVGLVLGLPVGAAAGYWLAQSMNLSKNQRLFCALAAGVYCLIPFTELLPLGTLIGALVRFDENGQSRCTANPDDVSSAGNGLCNLPSSELSNDESIIRL